MARVKQVTTKPRKFMGDAMKAAASSEKEREEGTEVENSNDETETVAERARKRKGKGIAGSEPSEKKKKMEKAPASKPFVQQNIFEPRYIKWDSFSDLPYEFEELFTFQGWMEFSELNEYYYPYLIQEFYGSMKEVVKGESFSVRVKKKSQIVDVDFLASVLNLPNDGNRIGTFKDSRKLEGYDEKAFQLSIFPEVERESSKIDEGESSKKKEKMKLKMSDFVKISKANLDMMKEIKEMSGLTLSILEKSHELQKGIMAEHNAKMDMLINRLDRQEWFMKKMAQMLFGESFGKFGDFGSYPQGTAGPSNAKAAGPSGVKISEVEEEEEEHVEAAEKVQEESKIAEVEEVEKMMRRKNLQKRHQKNKNLTKRNQRIESSSSILNNSSSDNGKSEGRNGSRQEERRKSSPNPSSEQPNIVPTDSQPVPESTISLPMQYGPRRTKAQARKSFYPFLQKSK
ncbi:hypothetical protein GH714_034441 [Hevea brasiliensis]|uniref:Uncharacterized protein n=1 Tax=Hevea brasiliensis TaxID=3981 RepID=A0A6A6K856_HEVBR|nr:hypothetical protein GH714_034441 [Hevea brasiliensis]